MNTNQKRKFKFVSPMAQRKSWGRSHVWSLDRFGICNALHEGPKDEENLAPKAWRIFGAKHRQNDIYIYIRFLNLLKTWNQKSYRDNKEIVRAKTSRGFEEHPPWEVEPFESKWWCHGKAGKRLHLPQHEFKIPQLTSVKSLQQMTSNLLQTLWFLENGSCVGELTMQTPWASKSSPSLSLGVALNEHDELWTWTWQGELGAWHILAPWSLSKSQVEHILAPHVASCPKERRQWRAKSLNDAQWVPAQSAQSLSTARRVHPLAHLKSRLNVCGPIFPYLGDLVELGRDASRTVIDEPSVPLYIADSMV